MNLTFAEFVDHIGDPDGRDTAAHLTNAQIAAALAQEAIPLACAVRLTELYGRVVGDDAPKCTGLDLSVVWHCDPGRWIAAAHEHVAALLAQKGEAGLLQRGAHLRPDRSVGSLATSRGLDLDELLASFCWQGSTASRRVST